MGSKEEKSSKKGIKDLPDDWEVSEESPEESEEKSGGFNTKYLWIIFIVAFATGVAYVAMTPQAPKEPTTVYVNGIPISADGNPVDALRSLIDRRDLVGTFINPDQTSAEKNGLLEIGEVLKDRTTLYSGGSGYNIQLGLTDRTGIFVHDNFLTIEGVDEESFWKAVWVFTSITSNSQINSNVALSEVPKLFFSVEEVAVLIDEENACSNWGLISSALGNINGALGFLQESSGFVLGQYLKNGENCELQFSLPERNVTGDICPTSSGDSFVVLLKQGDANKIEIKNNEISFIYTDCASLVRQSLILRDILAPEFLTGVQRLTFPTMATI